MGEAAKAMAGFDAEVIRLRNVLKRIQSSQAGVGADQLELGQRFDGR